jgi:hypothetical protein
MYPPVDGDKTVRKDRFGGCPDGGPCPEDGRPCVGPGVAALIVGSEIIAPEPFCSERYPDEQQRLAYLRYASRRVMCAEAIHDAAGHRVALQAISPPWTGTPTEMVLSPGADTPSA